MDISFDEKYFVLRHEDTYKEERWAHVQYGSGLSKALVSRDV